MNILLLSCALGFQHQTQAHSFTPTMVYHI